MSGNRGGGGGGGWQTITGAVPPRSPAAQRMRVSRIGAGRSLRPHDERRGYSREELLWLLAGNNQASEHDLFYMKPSS
eukprot:1136908-Pelagomonas_calceolata.AAC.3